MNSQHDPLDFRSARILVIGDVMLDQYWLGDTSRISPEAPVPVIRVTASETRLGGAANAALNAHSLGAAVTLAGIAGNDEHGAQLKKLLGEKGITDHLHTAANARTISKLRMISRNQQLVRADFEEETPAEVVADFTTRCIEALPGHQLVLLSDYQKGALGQCAAIIAAARKANIPVVVDPKGSDFTRYRGAFLLTPNMGEFEAIVGKCRTEQEMFTKAAQLIREIDLQALLLTRSEKGMTLFLKDGSHHHFNASAREVFDVTGAGDTVIATLATALASGTPLEQAALFANTAAGIVVGRMGAATVTPLELKLALENPANGPTGITTAKQLKELVSFEKSLGKKIVFTNGCFDILHSGHVQYLAEARALGDRLIVAINSDASVKRLKGPTRPINTLEDRMAVLSSLKAVDWVVSFESDTPEELLREIRPDILAKGGDYAISQVVGADIVLGYGGEIKVLSLQQGISTTNIIDSIKSR
jgi:D-beta-D-heptose 7-phosphate kinase/D-beta-D-heptose 1-phosphate adenosyltransferase